MEMRSIPVVSMSSSDGVLPVERRREQTATESHGHREIVAMTLASQGAKLHRWNYVHVYSYRVDGANTDTSTSNVDSFSSNERTAALCM